MIILNIQELFDKFRDNYFKPDNQSVTTGSWVRCYRFT